MEGKRGRGERRKKEGGRGKKRGREGKGKNERGGRGREEGGRGRGEKGGREEGDPIDGLQKYTLTGTRGVGRLLGTRQLSALVLYKTFFTSATISTTDMIN